MQPQTTKQPRIHTHTSCSNTHAHTSNAVRDSLALAVTAENEKRQLASVGKVKEPVTHIEKPLEENINRIQVEGDEARSVEEAIAVLSVKDPDVDRHPEKRVKAAYTAFEEVNMPRIKSENPTLRLSQLKQILRKDWMKSPENPLNQRFSS
uniref:Coiled-coil domain-containing protein n=1 Tax=Timema poppense TaxID=170557 RepID=A0A7R9DIC4_TIMPO|nr:unnamed protein product [Timema poppensis]